MKILLSTLVAGGFSLSIASGALAQSAQIPTPVNPYPINPIATDGTPLPSQSSAVRSGPSGAIAPFGFVGQYVDGGLNSAAGVIGGGYPVR